MISRRDVIRILAGVPLLGGPLGLRAASDHAAPATGSGNPRRRAIPSSGETLPVIGMGTWQTFDEHLDAQTRARLGQVLAVFFGQGGRLIDSSPMYGDSESVVGELIAERGDPDWFGATKVWTRGREAGIAQMHESMRRMRRRPMDLMQIHNLVDWEVHAETLARWKADGLVRYIGITTSHGRSHRELERALTRVRFDFVQLSYSIDNRVVEDRLLPLAAERGIAVLINRPYQGGSLFRRVRQRALPDWAGEFDCHSWGQFFLKFVLSHPAVTCVIPATSKPQHMRDNMAAAYGRLPDAHLRARMLALLGSI